jgi:hypothetical protein
MKMDLEKYKNKSGFKIPNNYMENFEANLFEKLEISSENAKESKSGFQVPQDYFSTLESRILSKVASDSSKGKIINLFSRKRLYYASTVAAIFIVMLSTFLFNSPDSNSINSIEYAALEEYINEGDLDYYDISNLIYEDGYIIESLNASNFNDEAIFDYLSENVEDSGLIIE